LERAKVTATQHTEATRKKLREAEFFLHRLASVDKGTVINTDPEAADFYLSAFLSAARAVGWTLKRERTAEWDAWNHTGWFTTLSKDENALWDFLRDQRNMVHKEGAPELTCTVTPVSLMEFVREQSLQGNQIFFNTGIPATPLTFNKLEKSFTAHPGQTLSEVCQPLLDLVTRMVAKFEQAHPPA
jgi:hypothetical protein